MKEQGERYKRNAPSLQAKEQREKEPKKKGHISLILKLEFNSNGGTGELDKNGRSGYSAALGQKRVSENFKRRGRRAANK